MAEATLDQPAYAWIKPYEGDFVKAFEALVAVCEGKASNDRRLNEALRTLSLDTKDGGGAVYVNEYTNDGMTGYATTLLDAFQVKGI